MPVYIAAKKITLTTLSFIVNLHNLLRKVFLSGLSGFFFVFVCLFVCFFTGDEVSLGLRRSSLPRF